MRLIGILKYDPSRVNKRLVEQLYLSYCLVLKSIATAVIKRNESVRVLIPHSTIKDIKHYLAILTYISMVYLSKHVYIYIYIGTSGDLGELFTTQHVAGN